jgi:NRPS condensation-like uncharacterized protein
MDQFNYALSEVSDQLMHFIVSFDGAIDEVRLRNALLQTFDIAPVLGCRFVEDDLPYWERLPAISQEEIFRIHPLEDPERDLPHIMVQPVEASTGPQVRLDVLRSVRDTLCITVHHAVMDANGLRVYAALLAQLYRSGEPYARQCETALPDRTLTPVISQFSPEERSALLAQNAERHAAWAFSAMSADCGERSFAIRTLSPECLRATKRNGKARGATVNDILIGAYFLTLCEFVKPEPDVSLPILLSIDLRRYIAGKSGPVPLYGQFNGYGSDTPPQGAGAAGCGIIPDARAICNLSVAFEVILKTGARTLDEVLPEVAATMRHHKAGTPGLASALDIESLAKNGYAEVRERVRMMKESCIMTGNENPFLANTGIIPDGMLEFSPDLPVLNAFIAGFVVYPPGIAVGVSTFRDMLTLSTGYCISSIPEETMERFLDAFVGKLSGF